MTGDSQHNIDTGHVSFYPRAMVSHLTLIGPRLLGQNDAHFLKSYFEIILLGWICAVHCWKLHTLRGSGFDCLLTWIFIKMEHPQPLHVCTIVCIIYDVHRGQDDSCFKMPFFTTSEFVRRFYCSLLQMKYILFVGKMLPSTDDIKMRQAIWTKNQTMPSRQEQTGFAQKPGKRGSVMCRI